MEETKENRKHLKLTALACIIHELIDTTSFFESDKEIKIMEMYTRKRTKMPRIENYMEYTIATLTDKQFLSAKLILGITV